MEKQVLFGTSNPAKIEYFRSYVEALPIKVLNPSDLGIKLSVEENGRSPQDNAKLKAMAYYLESMIPTIAIDAGLRIEKFPEEKQPGMYVRRARESGNRKTDEELVEYYSQELDKVGGGSWGYWQIGIAFAITERNIKVQEFSLRTYFTSKRSKYLTPGAPLSSLMIDAESERYYSEMVGTERPEAAIVFEFMKRNIDTL